jgi:hypothetical protein
VGISSDKDTQNGHETVEMRRKAVGRQLKGSEEWQNQSLNTRCGDVEVKDALPMKSQGW